jgi:hypothetical protein
MKTLKNNGGNKLSLFFGKILYICEGQIQSSLSVHSLCLYILETNIHYFNLRIHFIFCALFIAFGNYILIYLFKKSVQLTTV